MSPHPRTVVLRVAAGVIVFQTGFAATSYAVPSFARQTGMTCQACHTVFPELTPFGRSFKLNGYQIDNLPQVQGITPSKDVTLVLNYVPPLSLMFQTSFTKTGTALPDSLLPDETAQNGQVLFPQQASLFYAGTDRARSRKLYPDHVRQRFGQRALGQHGCPLREAPWG